ncbi:MAG TPA: hypothetical protein VNV86_01425 [Candidatus Acidoferrum sp.]|nr:hypothetical protein [Candidatus Acidoferrum sp.]
MRTILVLAAVRAHAQPCPGDIHRDNVISGAPALKSRFDRGRG